MPVEEKQWVLASFNAGKAREVAALMPAGFSLISLAEYSGATEPEENGDTLEANAHLKALAAHQLTGLPALADDTGLFVTALGGAPGVFSARFAGEPSDSAANIRKLLHLLKPETNRAAWFETVLCLEGFPGAPVFLKGRLYGTIASEPRGTNGFGYDPVFIPEGESRTLAEMTATEKNAISHRGIAIRQFLNWIQSHA